MNILKPAKLYDVNNTDWAPTINMGHESAGVRGVNGHQYDRLQSRKQKMASNDEAAAALLDLQNIPPPV